MPETNKISGAELRKQRGLQIAEVARIDRKGDSFLVPSMSGNGRYTVNPITHTCTCPDHEATGGKCKHQWAVEFFAKREITHHSDGTTTVTETVEIKAVKRQTYKQDWPNYNAAQTNEKDQVLELLHQLCKGIETPPQIGRGQRRIPLADAVFAVVFKTYSTFSGRRFISDLRAAHNNGLISKLPHYNSIFNYFENPELTPILTALVAESAKPLAAVENDFAVDSSGFATSRFVRWYDHKYNIVRQEHDWVKVHIAVGVKTNVVTSVKILDRDAGDAPLLPSLVDETAKNFTVKEVSADKAYSSIANHDAVEKQGATPFIVFKKNATGNGTRNDGRRSNSGDTWEKMFHYFSFKKDEFLAHYHKRSNVESTFSMVKAKFGDSVRSKDETAMKNEALAKLIAHNLCCLVHAFYELGIESTFWNPAA